MAGPKKPIKRDTPLSATPESGNRQNYAKPAYTPQDSASYEATGKRFDKDLVDFKKLGDIAKKTKDVGDMDKLRNKKELIDRRADTMSKSPFWPTVVKRYVEKKMKD